MQKRKNDNNNLRKVIIDSLSHKETPYIPKDIWLREEVTEKLMQHFNVSSNEEVLEKLGIGIRRFHFTPKKKLIKELNSNKHILLCEDEWGIKTERIGFYEKYVYHPLSEINSLEGKITSNGFQFSINETSIKSEIIKYKQKYVVSAQLPNLFKTAWLLRGFQAFMEDMCINTAYVDNLLDFILENTIEATKTLVRLGFDIIEFVGDVAGQNGLLFSIPMFRRFFKCRFKRIIKICKEANTSFFFFHSDGDMTELIPDLIDIGFDIINPIQPECMNPKEIKNKYGKFITLHGTISCQKTLPFGTTDDVRKEVKQRILDCGYEGGLILAPSNVVEMDVPLKNILAIYQ